MGTITNVPPPVDYTFEWNRPMRRTRYWCRPKWELGDTDINIVLEWGDFDRIWEDSAGPFNADRLPGDQFRDLDSLLELYEDDDFSWDAIVESFNARWGWELGVLWWPPEGLWAAYISTLKDGWLDDC